MRIIDWSSVVCSSDLPMMSLLVQRASVLMLRPAALMAEALLVPGGNVMIFAMPIAALALTASSIPVHTQYMMATSKSPNIECLERSYVSALLYITLIGSIVLFLILHLILKTSHFRSEEHTSELQSLMRISYAVFCLKKKKSNKTK